MIPATVSTRSSRAQFLLHVRENPPVGSALQRGGVARRKRSRRRKPEPTATGKDTLTVVDAAADRAVDAVDVAEVVDGTNEEVKINVVFIKIVPPAPNAQLHSHPRRRRPFRCDHQVQHQNLELQNKEVKQQEERY